MVCQDQPNHYLDQLLDLLKTYPMQHQNLIDNLLQLLQIKLVSESVCKSLINIFLNEGIYYLNLSRGVNFRPEDNSSVLKNKNYKLFIKNLTKKEGDHVINQIKKDKKLPIYMSHDLLSVVDLLEKIIPKFRILHIIRNPIDNIFSFYSKYNKRYKKKKYNLDNPRFFSLAFKKKKDCFHIMPLIIQIIFKLKQFRKIYILLFKNN